MSAKPRLTLLTVTAAQDYALDFITNMVELAGCLEADFLIAADGPNAARRLDEFYDNVTLVRSAGFIESVLDQAIARCPDGYILRLDDDERPTSEMEEWLFAREYETADHWAFPRLNLWPDEHSYITSMALYPDPQTRLSTKAKSGGRHRIHVGSPHGTGQLAPVHLEHHKFLVRSLDERRATVARYERLQPGAGERFRQFSVPEDMPADLIVVESRQEAMAA